MVQYTDGLFKLNVLKEPEDALNNFTTAMMGSKTIFSSVAKKAFKLMVVLLQ